MRDEAQMNRETGTALLMRRHLRHLYGHGVGHRLVRSVGTNIRSFKRQRFRSRTPTTRYLSIRGNIHTRVRLRPSQGPAGLAEQSAYPSIGRFFEGWPQLFERIYRRT